MRLFTGSAGARTPQRVAACGIDWLAPVIRRDRIIPRYEQRLHAGSIAPAKGADVPPAKTSASAGRTWEAS